MIHIELELTDKQAAALRGALQVMHRQRLQEEFWQDRYRYIPHGMRAATIISRCPELDAGVKLLTALQMAERSQGHGDKA